MVEWLNQNQGAVMAALTAVLVMLTFVYCVTTALIWTANSRSVKEIRLTRTFQQHIADFLIREHEFGVLEQDPTLINVRWHNTCLTNARLRGADDQQIWDYARGQGLVVVSKDTNFRERRFVGSAGVPPAAAGTPAEAQRQWSSAKAQVPYRR